MRAAQNPGDNRISSTPSVEIGPVDQRQDGDNRSFARYVFKAYQNEQRKQHNKLPCTKDEFLAYVKWELAQKLGSEQEVRAFRQRIEDARAEDRMLKAAGLEASVFKGCSEKKVLVNAVRIAVRGVIAEKRAPRPTAKPSRRARDEMSVDALESLEATSRKSRVHRTYTKSPQACVELNEDIRIMEEALEELDSLDQAILVAKYCEEKKQIEIADSLKVPRSTVNRRLPKALDKLTAIMKRRGLGD